MVRSPPVEQRLCGERLGFNAQRFSKGAKLATKVRSRKVIQDYYEAMHHPLREKIWLFLQAEGVSSPKEIAIALGEKTPDVSHHTKRLKDLGFVELVEERPVRGAVQHFYRSIRPVLIDDDDWKALCENWPTFADRKIGDFIQGHIDDYRDSIEAGTLSRDSDFMISRNPVYVDAIGREELHALLLEVEAERIVEIVRRSKERREKSGEGGVNMSILLAGFETPAGRAGSTG